MRRTGRPTGDSSTTRRARAPTRPRRCSPRSTGSTRLQVRVIVPDVGGGFGAKSRDVPGGARPRLVTPAPSGRPVRWTETRSENIVAMPDGRGPAAVRPDRRYARRSHHRLSARRRAGRRRLPADRRLAARRDAADGDGRLPPRQRRLHRRLGRHQHRVDHRLPRRRAARGGGGDRADGRPLRRRDRRRPGRGSPAQLRRRPSPSRTPPASAPSTTSATIRRRCDSPSTSPATTSCVPSRRPAGVGRPGALGIGIATYVEVTAAVQTPEPASVELADDGDLIVRSGATPYGQGHDTTWAMIVADATGVPRGADRGRPRRHRPRARRRSHGRFTFGAARWGGVAGATTELVVRHASGRRTASRRTSPTSCSTRPPGSSTSPARRRAASDGATSSTATATAGGAGVSRPDLSSR